MASKAEEGSGGLPQYIRERLEKRFRNANPDVDTQEIDFEGEYDPSLSYGENVKNIEENVGYKLKTKEEQKLEEKGYVDEAKRVDSLAQKSLSEQMAEAGRDEYYESQRVKKPRVVSVRGPRVVSIREGSPRQPSNLEWGLRERLVLRAHAVKEKVREAFKTSDNVKFAREFSERASKQSYLLSGRAKKDLLASKAGTYARFAIHNPKQAVVDVGSLVEEKTAGSLKPRRSGVPGFVFGKTNRPPLAPKNYQRFKPSDYVYKQAQRPRRYYVGPQSIRSDGLPQHFGPTHDYRVATSLRLFDDYAVGSPIAKYGGGLPRFFDKARSSLRSASVVGVNSKRSMFKKGVFG